MLYLSLILFFFLISLLSGGDDPDGQVLLINAVKDVASALGDLISSTKMAAGKSSDDPTMLPLKNSAKVSSSSSLSASTFALATNDPGSISYKIYS